jgi:hypothetical protein
VASELEIGVDPLLQRGEPQLLEARDLGLSERLEREVCERRPAPERQGLAQAIRRDLGFGLPGLAQQRVEPIEIDLVSVELESVARCPCDEHLGAERLAQPGHVSVKCRRRGLGRVLAPQIVDQLVGGDDLVRVEEQNRKQRALLRAAEGDRSLSVDDFERPKNLVVHVPAGDRTTFQATRHLRLAGV